MVTNTALPSSTLKKKHNAIAYHKVRESIAAGLFGFCHIPGNSNIADILTKPLGPNIHQRHARSLLFQNPHQVTDHGEYQEVNSSTGTGTVTTDQWHDITVSIGHDLTRS